jgi:hypothetical protein
MIDRAPALLHLGSTPPLAPEVLGFADDAAQALKTLPGVNLAVVLIVGGTDGVQLKISANYARDVTDADIIHALRTAADRIEEDAQA